MIYGSVCSGIEAASVAWHKLGWRPAFFSEIDRFPRAVLAHHFPEVPLHGDFTTIEAGRYPAIDLLVGGTPCQDFSVAGLRAGLAGERGNLTLEYLRLAGRLRPRWVVWENVPGVLSSDGGRALGAFLGGLAELGYGFAWRVLDAQYVRVDGFGRAVPQRRRRVFVVGYLGDWRRAAAVLFERESLCGNPPPRREAGEGVAGTLGGSSQSGGFRTTDLDNTGAFIAEVARPALAGGHGNNPLDENLIAFAIQGAATRENPLSGPDGVGVRQDGAAYTIEARSEVQAVAYEPITLAIRGRGDGRNLETRQDGTANAILTPNGGRDGIGVGAVIVPAQRWAVRRLTPRECERLQGFPDDYTLVPFGKKLATDGHRYKAIGNSMAVNVMRWIGTRISRVEAMGNQFGEAA